jgi:hypothetical protein
VNEQQGRTPPDDPWSITLTYRHDHRWWSGTNEEPESWHVSADVFDDSGMHVKSHVGDMTIVVIDVYQTHDPFGLLDGEDADLGAIAGTIFDARTGQLDPDLDDLLEPMGDRILILSSVRLTPGWRGFGLGVLLAGTAIKKLSGGVRAAVCYPAPIDELNDEEPDSPAAREQAIAALGKVWARLGFEHFKDGVHVLDLSLVTLDESLGRLHKRAEQHRRPD